MREAKFFLRYRHNPDGFMFSHEFLVECETPELPLSDSEIFSIHRRRRAFIDHHHHIFREMGGTMCSQYWEPYKTHVFAFPETSKAVRIKLMLPLDF